MNVCAIICEYNPFHNGHLFHMNAAREASGCEYVICVMSGSFTQRGECAITDKWARTRHALLSGADLVIELPAIYAAQSAEGFANGAVGIINALNVCDSLCFGSESDELDLLKNIADIPLSRKEEYSGSLKDALKSGVSMAEASTEAVARLMNNTAYDVEKVKNVLSSPNCVLGIEYIRALTRIKSEAAPIAIKRVGAAHNDETIPGETASASAIRQALIRGDDVSQYVPNYVGGFQPTHAHAFGNTILTLIRKMTADELSRIYGVSEGLENRMKSAAAQTSDYREYLSILKTRRYPHTRLTRIGLSVLLGLTHEAANELLSAPLYARILGIKKSSAPLLSEIKRRAALPVISKPADYKSILSRASRMVFEHDVLASDIYALSQPKEFSKSGRDFTEGIIII